MKQTQQGITVNIFGKEFMVACPDEEREQLMEAARYLDGKMQQIHQSGKVLGAERCAIMAALNIAHELLQIQQSGGVPADFSEKIRDLSSRIGDALGNGATGA